MVEAHKFTRDELEKKFSSIEGWTFRQIDKAGVLDPAKKNKGHAGAVIEQSVLGYPADSDQRPDLNVDGVLTELKTTGVRKKTGKNARFVAKEPVSVTAVRPERIVDETFENSAFWEKTAHILFIWYWYIKTPESPTDYGDFPVEGFYFKDFTGEDKAVLMHDWTIVRDFIAKIQRDFPEDPTAQYSRISTELNSQRLTVIDTAPKWPNRPRFRLKRSFVDTILQEWQGYKFEKLPSTYIGIEEIEDKCRKLTYKYAGMSLQELYNLFGIEVKSSSKQASERAIVKMFGGTATKMGRVKDFAKFSLKGKSVTLTEKGARTEDLKLMPVEFDEIMDPDMKFEDSLLYSTFADYQMLCIVFEEPDAAAQLETNVFRGFKRLYFDEQFIEDCVRLLWDEMRTLIFEGKLRDVIVTHKDGTPVFNKNGIIRSAPNWPKATDGNVFIRGGGVDSSRKPQIINGIRMLKQYYWIKGQYIAEKLRDIPFL